MNTPTVLENHTEIVLCHRCKGSGVHAEYMAGNDHYWVACEYCGGSGRLIKETVVRRFTPEKI